MFSRLATCILLVAATVTPGGPSPPAARPGGSVTRTVDFSDVLGPVTVAHDGAEVALQPRPENPNDPVIEVTTSIHVAGYPAATVSEGGATSRYYERWVGIGRLTAADPAPSVLLAGFSGGAHCCATLTAVVPYQGRLRVIEFEGIDGEPSQSFPRDIDGDGVADFVRQDDSFRYQFASGAGSWSPPVVYNIEQGRIVDVSTRPAFRFLWQDFAHRTRAYCADRSNDDRNGACAAYVAAAARLGQYQEAMREVERLARPIDEIRLYEACTVPLVDGVCPEGREIVFDGFPSALRWFLRAHHYID
jgi:hypothetical protein